mmetsp:Transcript_29503/g.50234  ORF Transcript_29503/g.50234 Transcript_29503/m.50234 type:complete len:107 (-) Transcript_29503:20-340(-)
MTTSAMFSTRASECPIISQQPWYQMMSSSQTQSWLTLLTEQPTRDDGREQRERHRITGSVQPVMRGVQGLVRRRQSRWFGLVTGKSLWIQLFLPIGLNRKLHEDYL